MSQRASRQATARAEARRRARLAARGDDESVVSEEESEPESAPRPSFLQRILPAAPPLAGFAYEGRFRGAVEATYLLGRHPLAWLLPGLFYVAIYELALWSEDRL